ncbi:GNAT family N-acetyltransferase [Amycolatopsis benzoatilytica]|uniref:GNAT family N-acetyltransferase n=1 Tax=Amycolatopsis benzoatilytica TaxID=346045 RepID=UPI0003803ECF|nr:GNAT family N-acetyltransferase [Amycolatopsis benzoatilytica]
MIRIADLATRPELRGPALRLGSVGGEFLGRGLTAGLASSARLAAHWPEFFLVLLDAAETPVARAAAIPVAFPADDRSELPDHGWDGALVWAAEDHLDGTPPTTLVALEVYVAETARGQGIAGIALAELKERARRAGLDSLVVPVRPTGKPPLESIVDYLATGADPWLRSHERLGGQFRKVAPFAMTVIGTFAQWQEWTGVRLRDGPNVVPGGIAPVIGSAAQDLGGYVEPNVWYEHPL